ncbi:hypothetical protein [Paraburkholderia dipogonis]|uniref:hypothetical protein n=1 Tax=Paraburkholderia dipogonis TaxID=1211383 RepID=UPI0038B8B368
MPKKYRVDWPQEVANAILTKCHHRCCICVEHRRVSNIHHIDEDPSNSVESNGVGLCGECHPDVHTKSSMRRNITPAQISQYKKKWEEACGNLSVHLAGRAHEFSEGYYINVHRLESLYQRSVGRSLLSGMPHQPVAGSGVYNTLWNNSLNSLTWVQLAENRSYFESCAREVLPFVSAIDLNLIEVGAVDAKDKIGSLVAFSCQFLGHDIPDESELVQTLGSIDGPPPTMRRTIRDHENQDVFETCLMLDMQYMFASSAFIHFAEQGYWCGLARIVKIRDGVGSNDGIYSRVQLVLSPICIGIPLGYGYVSRTPGDATNPDERYLELGLSAAD